VASNVSSALAGRPAEVRTRLQRGVTAGCTVAFAALAALVVIMLTVAAIAWGPGRAGQPGAVW
jgi:hypothetical protein